MKTAIVTDSTAYISQELQNSLNINVIPLTVIFGNEIYEEEKELNVDDFYQMVREKELPTTSQPSLGKFMELYESLAKDYDAVISIHISSGISGTYQGAVTAGSMVENIEVYPFDTEISCMVQGFYVVEAAKMANQGKSAAEILARLAEMKQSVNAYFMVDDLTHLQRGGRLSGAQALIGSLLQVKPLLHFQDKKIVPFEKIRTRKKALKRMAELLGEAISGGGRFEAVIIHANREEEAKEWLTELKSHYPEVNFSISYFGAVIGTHLGEGAMGLGWYKS